MERYFCNGKKDFCEDSTGCAKCNHKNGYGGFWENDIKNVFEYYFGDNYDIYRIRKLVQADRDGRCVVLPVKVEQNIYRPLTKGIGKWFIEELTVKGIEYNGFEVNFICCSKPDEKGRIAWCDISQNSIGKTVFLTRKAAEKRWKGRYEHPTSYKKGEQNG